MIHMMPEQTINSIAYIPIPSGLCTNYIYTIPSRKCKKASKFVQFIPRESKANELMRKICPKWMDGWCHEIVMPLLSEA
jgi:hypothetical protein